MPKLEINGKTVEVGDEFNQLSPEEKDRTVNEIAAHMGSASPSTPKNDAQPRPASDMLSGAEESLTNELPANVMEGLGALWRTAQNNGLGHGKLGDEIVDSLGRGAEALRASGRAAYQRPTDVPESPTKAFAAGDYKGALRSLGYGTAEGVGSAVPTLAGLALAAPTGGASLLASMGIAGAGAAGEAEHRHGTGSGLTKSDLANIAAQTAISRIPGFGISGEVGRNMLSSAAQQVTDATQGQGGPIDPDKLLDAAAFGAVTGAGNKYVVSPALKGIQTATRNFADNRVANKNGYGQSLARIAEQQQAMREYSGEHADAVQRFMDAHPDASTTEALDGATDALAAKGMEAPEPLSSKDRRNAAELAFASNVARARSAMAGTTKPSDATLANGILDQAKTDANDYIQALRNAGPENGGINSQTAQTMKKMAYAAGTHNHDRITGDNDFVMTPEDQVMALSLPPSEKSNFLHHLDVMSVAAHNGREGAQGTLGQKVINTAAKAATRGVAGALGFQTLGVPGALAALTLGHATDHVADYAGRALERRLGIGGAPALRGANQRQRIAQAAGVDTSPSLPLLQQAAQAALARARAGQMQRMPQQHQQAPEGFSGQHGQAYRPNPSFDPQAALQAAQARQSGRPQQEPSYNTPTAGNPVELLAAYQQKKAAQAQQKAQQATDAQERARRMAYVQMAARSAGLPKAAVVMGPDGRPRVRVPMGTAPQQPQQTPTGHQHGGNARGGGSKTVNNIKTANISNVLPPSEVDGTDLAGVRSAVRYRGRIASQDNALMEALTSPAVPKGAEGALRLVRELKHPEDKERVIAALMRKHPSMANGIYSATLPMTLYGSGRDSDRMPKARLDAMLKGLGME